MEEIDWEMMSPDACEGWQPPVEGCVVRGMPEGVYHGGPGVSSSRLKIITSRSELHYRERGLSAAIAPTPAMLTGRVLHAMVLEPDSVSQRYRFAANLKLNTTAGKQSMAAIKAEAEEAGAEVVRDDEAHLWAMARAISAHPAWDHIIGPAPMTEVSLFWRDPATGLSLKCRPDNLNLSFGTTGRRALCVDLKSAEDASDRAFRRSVKEYGYDFSAAMYQAGVAQVTGQQTAWAWFLFEKRAPYATRVIYAGEKWLARGRELYRDALERLARAQKTGNWPGYDGGKATVLDFTRWDGLTTTQDTK